MLAGFALQLRRVQGWALLQRLREERRLRGMRPQWQLRPVCGGLRKARRCDMHPGVQLLSRVHRLLDDLLRPVQRVLTWPLSLQWHMHPESPSRFAVRS